MFFASTLHSLSFTALSFLSTFVAADTPNFNNSSFYLQGHYGDYPVQSYISNPEIVGPVANVLIPPKDGVSPSGYILWTPVAPHSPHRGPSVLDANTLSLVYQGPVYDKETIGANVQTCNGTNYITWWSGKGLNGRKAGHYMMLSDDYSNVYNVSAVGLHYADAHEFFLTPNCTAVFTAYQARQYNLAEYGLEKGYLLDSYFQEVDIATNKLLFQWQASQHVNVSDSFLTYNMSGQGRSVYDPFDFFHINSVEKDARGNYLVSSRHMHSVYYVDGASGDIKWTLGGRQNQFEDASGGNATNFAWQHHARWASSDLTAISLYDNKNSRYEKAEDPVSRGIIVSLDYTNMTAALNASYRASSNISSIREGSVQVLPDTDGTVLIGYGNEPGFTEVSANGTILWDVRFGPLNRDRESADNYRAVKVNWTGTPSWSPSIAAGPADAHTMLRRGRAHLNFSTNTTNDTAYFSWNGATEVTKWVILATNDTADILNTTSKIWSEVTKNGFESHILVGKQARYVRALAVNMYNRILGATPVLDVQTGELINATFDLHFYNAMEGSVFGSTWKLLEARIQIISKQGGWKIAAEILGGAFGVAVLALVIWISCRQQRIAKSCSRKLGGGYSNIDLADEAFDATFKLEAGIEVTEIDEDESEVSGLLEYDEKNESKDRDLD